MQGASCRGDRADGLPRAGEIGDVEAADFGHPGVVRMYLFYGDFTARIRNELAHRRCQFPQVTADALKDRMHNVRRYLYPVPSEFCHHKARAILCGNLCDLVDLGHLAELLYHCLRATAAGMPDQQEDAGGGVLRGVEKQLGGFFASFIGIGEHQNAVLGKQGGAEQACELTRFNIAGAQRSYGNIAARLASNLRGKFLARAFRKERLVADDQVNWGNHTTILGAMPVLQHPDAHRVRHRHREGGREEHNYGGIGTHALISDNMFD